MTTIRSTRPQPPRVQAEATRSELRIQALARDGRCVWCAVTGQKTDRSDVLESAHLRGIGAGGRKSGDTLENLITLCRWHHDLLDGRSHSSQRFEVAGLLAHIIKTR